MLLHVVSLVVVLASGLIEREFKTIAETNQAISQSPSGKKDHRLCRRVVKSRAKSSSHSVEIANVYLLGGQSNMQGLGKLIEIPEGVPRAIPHAFFWNGKSFEPLVLGETRTSSKITEFGPEIGLALEVATADCPIFLVKYHASGMPLHHGWDGGMWVGGDPAPGRRTFYPGENTDDPNMGTLYVKMREEFRAALEHLKQSGRQPMVRGFVWMQGEQDSKEEISAASYAESLKRLRGRLAEDLQCDEPLPMVFGQVLPHVPALERFKYRETIREQMAACDAGSGRTESMPCASMISTDGFSLLPDTVHYDTNGQLKLGEAFGKALKQMSATNSEPEIQ